MAQITTPSPRLYRFNTLPTSPVEGYAYQYRIDATHIPSGVTWADSAPSLGSGWGIATVVWDGAKWCGQWVAMSTVAYASTATNSTTTTAATTTTSTTAAPAATTTSTTAAPATTTSTTAAVTTTTTTVQATTTTTTTAAPTTTTTTTAAGAPAIATMGTSDSFNRADSSSLGSTDVAYGGTSAAWATGNGLTSTAGTVATYAITSNKLAASGSTETQATTGAYLTFPSPNVNRQFEVTISGNVWWQMQLGKTVDNLSITMSMNNGTLSFGSGTSPASQGSGWATVGKYVVIVKGTSATVYDPNGKTATVTVTSAAWDRLIVRHYAGGGFQIDDLKTGIPA